MLATAIGETRGNVHVSQEGLATIPEHLEQEMTTHSSILAWRIPWTEEPGGLQYMVSQESDMT